MGALKLIVDQHASPEAKIALFRSLFRGREDVYPRRFESRRTEKAGYAPACANEWVRGICEKPRIKCAECPNRQFLSVTERVIRWHLSGQDDVAKPFVAGVYPMLLDETCFFLATYADQWAFLSTVGRLTRTDVEAIVAEGERRGHIVGVRLPADDEDSEPWKTPPSRRRPVPPRTGELPASIDLVLGNEVYIPKQGLSPWLRNHCLRLAAFQNPEFYSTQAMRLPTYGKPRIVSCAEDHSAHIALPRGCLDDLRDLFAQLRIEFTLRDERCGGEPLDVTFHGELRPDQKRAVDALMVHDTGVLAATTAFGKTVVWWAHL